MKLTYENTEIKLDDNCKISLPIYKIKELTDYLEMDEIVDGLESNKKIDQLIERLCMDHWDKLALLLNKFFNHKSDACPLEAAEQEKLEVDFEDYLANKYKL